MKLMRKEGYETMNNNISEYKRGVLEVLFCMIIWGFLPIYWKALIPIDSWVIILYRVLMVFVTALILALRKYSWVEIWKPLREDRKTVRTLAIAGVIITVNWSTYIWSVNHNYILQSSLGYYIEPLMVCLLGILLFHEKSSKYKYTAMLFALSAVMILLIHFHQLPTIALGIAITFSVYAAIKRSVTIDPILSMIYETLFLVPIALGITLYLEFTSKGAIAAGQPYQYVLLLLCGVATAGPLILFAAGAQKTSMFILGLVEYVSPTMQMLLGVFLYHESVDAIQMLAFCIIWGGLVFFTYGELRDSKSNTIS